MTGNAALVGQSLDSDIIVEPVRGPLIPGFAAVKAAAKAAGVHFSLKITIALTAQPIASGHCCKVGAD